METAIFIVILIYSIVLHEIGHGAVAYLFGDSTAKWQKRLTLNPLPHLDTVGSIILPTFLYLAGMPLFGWAKPVPVNPYHIKAKWGMFFVSLAGIAVNFILASIAILILKLGFTGAIPMGEMTAFVLFTIIKVNLALGLFNLIPVPPFDGMNILREAGLVPRQPLAMEHNPLFMIIAIMCAAYVFPYIYSPVMGFVYSLF